MTLTIYPELEQGSDEWLQARCGIITASQIGKLITPTLKVADNDTSRNLTLTLAAERITGHVEYVHPSFEMMRGTDDEPFAREVYANHYAPVEEVGFMTLEHDGYTVGYSPDGLVGNFGLIEIKSRNPRIQLATISANKVPAANMAQIQAGMFVTNRDWCDYVSFSAGLPLYVKRVYPDHGWFTAIHLAAKAFEANVTKIVTDYEAATVGLHPTERRPELDGALKL
ncbi:MAG: lambda exonuclease family protein [Mycobacterium sp.]